MEELKGMIERMWKEQRRVMEGLKGGGYKSVRGNDGRV